MFYRLFVRDGLKNDKTASMDTNDKSEELNKRIEDLEKEFTSTPLFKGRNIYYLVGLLIFPLVVSIIFFCFRPSFILTQKKEGFVRDRKKLVRWTLVVTFVAYSAVYLYACYRRASAEGGSTPTISFSPGIRQS